MPTPAEFFGDVFKASVSDGAERGAGVGVLAGVAWAAYALLFPGPALATAMASSTAASAAVGCVALAGAAGAAGAAGGAAAGAVIGGIGGMLAELRNFFSAVEKATSNLNQQQQEFRQANETFAQQNAQAERVFTRFEEQHAEDQRVIREQQRIIREQQAAAREGVAREAGLRAEMQGLHGVAAEQQRQIAEQQRLAEAQQKRMEDLRARANQLAQESDLLMQAFVAVRARMEILAANNVREAAVTTQLLSTVTSFSARFRALGDSPSISNVLIFAQALIDALLGIGIVGAAVNAVQFVGSIEEEAARVAAQAREAAELRSTGAALLQQMRDAFASLQRIEGEAREGVRVAAGTGAAAAGAGLFARSAGEPMPAGGAAGVAAGAANENPGRVFAAGGAV